MTKPPVPSRQRLNAFVSNAAKKAENFSVPFKNDVPVRHEETNNKEVPASSTKWYTNESSNDNNGDENTGSEAPKQPKFGNDEISFGRRPQQAYCNSCKRETMTTISYKFGRASIIGAIGTFFIFPGCAVFMLKSNRFKDIEHKCSICRKKLGKKKRGCF